MSDPMDEAERRRQALASTLPTQKREQLERSEGSTPADGAENPQLDATLPAISLEGLATEATQIGPPPAAPPAARARRAATLPGHAVGAKKETPADATMEVVSSARVATMPQSSDVSGSVTLSGDRLGENLARELINRRFQQAGLEPVADYTFHNGDLLLALDGFDPQRNIGYQYVSHADADVVTDFDAAAEARLTELRTAGVASVLVIHDHQAETSDELVQLVDRFLTELGLR